MHTRSFEVFCWVMVVFGAVQVALSVDRQRRMRHMLRQMDALDRAASALELQALVACRELPVAVVPVALRDPWLSRMTTLIAGLLGLPADLTPRHGSQGRTEIWVRLAAGHPSSSEPGEKFYPALISNDAAQNQLPMYRAVRDCIKAGTLPKPAMAVTFYEHGELIDSFDLEATVHHCAECHETYALTCPDGRTLLFPHRALCSLAPKAERDAGGASAA